MHDRETTPIVPSPVWRSIVGGAGLLVIVAAGLASLSPCRIANRSRPPRSYRLVLDAPSDPSCFYATTFEEGPFIVSHDGSDGRSVHFSRQYEWRDGCTWEAREALSPQGAALYSYSYAERAVACPPGAAPARACPRVGVVTVEPM
jgi:hypothetical protein